MYQFNKEVYKHKHVFCFYLVLVGDDRKAFARCLVRKVNEENFEVQSLQTGGMSVEGWLHIMTACTPHLLHHYRLFYATSNGDLFYVVSKGRGPKVDIVLHNEGGHMERMKVHGRYPKIQWDSVNNVRDIVLH